jgi:phosphate acyltransferase
VESESDQQLGVDDVMRAEGSVAEVAPVADGMGSGAGPVVLALDAEWGDNAPEEIVAGAALAAGPDLRVVLVGRPEVVEPLLETRLRGAARSYVDIISSASVISSHDEPATAVRTMSDSSIVVGARSVAEGRTQGFVSAGSTGAVLAAGLLIVKRVPGIRRPAILTILPGLDGPVLFLDAGANADCRPEYLLEFGVLGTAYARCVLGVEHPRVGLLNIGEEETKGSELALQAHQMLAASSLTFAGNIEGRDLLMNKVDVVVTDGFTGNVALKLLEGCSSYLFKRVMKVAGGSTRARLGGLLLRPALRGLRTSLDPEEYGGTYLLGVKGLVVICHGNATRRAIANALRFGARALRQGILETVDSEVEKMLGSDAGAE